MKTQKTIAVVSAITLAFALTACGNKATTSDTNSVSEEVSSVEEVAVEPTQGVGEGNKYTNDYFGLTFEFPAGWTFKTENIAGEVDCPYFESPNEWRNSASFRLMNKDEIEMGEIENVGNIVINGTSYECSMIDSPMAQSKVFIIVFEKDGKCLLFSSTSRDYKTIEEFQTFIDSISK